MQTQKKGFTLIELLVVIAIIGILSAIGLVALNGAREKARDAQRKTDIATMRTAMQLYTDDHDNKYPGATNTTNIPENVSGTNFATAMASYIPTIPAALGANTSTCNNANHYWYAASNTVAAAPADHFVLLAQLESAGCTLTWIANDQIAGQVTNAAAGTWTAATTKCLATNVAGDICGSTLAAMTTI